MSSNRIIFANQLRGIGALSVLVSHYIGIFWLAHPEISKLMGVPELLTFPSLPDALKLLSEYCIVFGQFGVGVFFIVSGLVIPISLKNVSWQDFILRRAIRIYPVYIVGFCIVILSIYLLSRYAGSDFKYTPGEIFAHFGVITRGPLGVDRIDGISWTLEVEIYFYLIMLATAKLLLRNGIKETIAASLLVSFIAFLVMHNNKYLLGVQIGSGLMLLLGVAFYKFINNKISKKEFILLQAILCALIPITWFCGTGITKYTQHWVYGYLLAIFTFNACFYLKDKIKDNAFLSHLADISYPIYVVHALFGYSIMYVALDNGLGVYSSICAAVISAYVASLALHIFVEKPTMLWIKQSHAKRSAVQNS
ncbi:acyltransferase [Pseudomonas sp. Leaf58]|uniref:acyltransferase family protein n=1 Tax=Pseudomonas sp. Leaf58 TaxID=1736226 RepID=UPI0009EAB7FF|nr:acyltransferase [Pseudomonas sp. Leaf58]AYG47522.1 acyltransferase [Pseudomonas sp. Leaf58]